MIGSIFFIPGFIDRCLPSGLIFIEGRNILVKSNSRVTISGQIERDNYYIIPFDQLKKISYTLERTDPNDEAVGVGLGCLFGIFGAAIGAILQVANKKSINSVTIFTENGSITIPHVANPIETKKTILLAYRDSEIK